jgi:hypothetical protein
MQRRNRPDSSPELPRESSQTAAQGNRTLTESLPPIQAKAIAQLMAARQPRTPAEPTDPDPATDEPSATDDEQVDAEPATEDSPGDPA